MAVVLGQPVPSGWDVSCADAEGALPVEGGGSISFTFFFKFLEIFFGVKLTLLAYCLWHHWQLCGVVFTLPTA